MRCPYCGKENPAGGVFCIECGKSFADSSFRNIQENKKEKSVRGVNKALIVIIVILSFLVLAGAVVMVLHINGVLDISSLFSVEYKVNSNRDYYETTNYHDRNPGEVEYTTAGYLSISLPDGEEYLVINVGTGGIHGTYYAFSEAVCRELSCERYGFDVLSTGGSAINIAGVSDGTYQMAICQNDVMNYAYNGINQFADPVRGFSVIACIYPEICQLVTTEDSGIYSLEDLRGKTVAIGDVSSGVYYNAVHILEAAGIDVEIDINAVYSSFGDAATALKDGSVDAAFITSGIPTTAICDLSTSTDVRVISIPDDVIDKLISKYPFYTEYILTDSNYDFIDSPVTTICVKSTFIVCNDMSEQQVYEITKALWEDPDVKKCHAKATEMDISTTLSGVGSVPVHPGALRYYREAGIIS